MSDLEKLLSNLRSHPTSLKEMVKTQLLNRDITDDKVLDAFLTVDRKHFLPGKYKKLAYADQPVDIGHQQTISQPYVVAFMTEKLQVTQESTVLEVGTGCGYQTALLAQLAKHVFSIEYIEDLIPKAQQNLKKIGVNNVTIYNKNGREGLPEQAQFDRIIVTAGSRDFPKALLDQLADQGRMIIPVGKTGVSQELYLVQKKNCEIIKKAILPVRFVPLV